ncbi:unnamed protein product [Brassicogethes aeneus]|uniref:Solute carrier family 25 member 32 n=1 Tax=Brassicogethes aeneus TaxID=1431903 RepID=A0A9P0FJE9_BRAAE|nr:unnamed protein product [Brassicogethes aeneus]
MAAVKNEGVSVTENFEIFSHLRYEHLVAGTTAGLTSTVTLHPLDVIKIRFAAHDGRHQYTPKYSGIANAFVTIAREEGLRGLYKGVVPNCWGAGASWGLYFLFYNSSRTIWAQRSKEELGPLENSLAAALSGALTLVITNPLWVVKTRLCLQHNDQSRRYSGMVDALTKIYHNEGVKGYYRGFVPGLFGVSHGAVQFVVYEEMKTTYGTYYNLPQNSQLGTVQYLTFAAISKIIAAGVTYPYQVVRTRLQNQYYTYKGSLDCIRQTWAFEGWRGFYKGLGSNLIRVTPATMITFVTYEKVSHFLMKRSKNFEA